MHRSDSTRRCGPRSGRISPVELLENRRFMSVSVPAGYTQVQTLTFDSTSTAAQAIPVAADRDYFFKATGAHVWSPSPTLHADAASTESYVGFWSAETRLHIKSGSTDLVYWGTHVTDSEYGASYHADSTTTLWATLAGSDSPDDNTGSVSLAVYRKVIVGTVTVIETGGVGAGVTASGNYGGNATLTVTPNASNQSTLNISALVSPTTADAPDKVAWAAYDAAGHVLGGDTFDSGGDSVTVTFGSSTDTFTIRAGTDTNGNGAFDYGTETASRTITVQRVVPVLAATSTSTAGASSGNPLSIARGSLANFDSVVRKVNGSATTAAFSFSAASGISVTASALGDGSYRMAISVASGVATGSYTIAVSDSTDSRVSPLYLYVTVS